MVDIKQLKQYPLAFKELEKWVERRFESYLAIYWDGKVRNEDIVEFLDEYGFICTVSLNMRWSCKIVTSSNNCGWSVIKYNSINEFNSRLDAMYNCILTAFFLLENKLKTN